jgi:hypothetical protein
MTYYKITRRILVAVSLLSVGSLYAQEAAQPGENAWRLQLTPYVWMTGLQGEIRPNHSMPTAHVSQSFSDVLSNLDAATFLSGTARKGRYVLHGDLTYASVSDSATLPMGLKGKAEVTQRSMTLLGGYNWRLSSSDNLDILVGLRWWNIRANVQVQPLLQARVQESFADPIVAARWRHQWDQRWSTLLYTDVGGFGMGSEFTWQILTALNYQVRDNIFLTAGYRHMSVKYRGGGAHLDVGMGGPVLGATFRF